ncbi:hypothetical protein [Leucobacter japonicus]|uniref:hypothetical protein n=1 Tax=Leucobacter japonicus TaxID=1461259 RepID=UPI0006A7E470|nr:hypothetical protein [Leucobacter japonicus]
MTSARASAALRGTAAAALATFVALLSHVAGGGEVPGVLGIVVPLVLSTLVCVALAGRRLSLPRLTISVAVSQFLFHALFILGATNTTASPSASAMPKHVHAITASFDPSTATTAHLGHAGAAMWVAHAIACLLTVVALSCAETSLASLAALARLLVASLSRLRPVAPEISVSSASVARPTAFHGSSAVVLPLGVYPSVHARRGPPALTASC